MTRDGRVSEHGRWPAWLFMEMRARPVDLLAWLSFPALAVCMWWTGRFEAARLAWSAVAVMLLLSQVHTRNARRGSWLFFLAGLAVLVLGYQLWELV